MRLLRGYRYAKSFKTTKINQKRMCITRFQKKGFQKFENLEKTDKSGTMVAVRDILEIVLSNTSATWLETSQFFACILGQNGSGQSFSQCYYNSNALVSGYALCIVFIVYSFVWSIVGNNCSKVDQIWSIVPVLYCWHFCAHFAGTHSDTHYPLLLLCTLVTLWGSRLTFNFWRKDGYGTFFVHEEDYRWPILRAKMHPIVFLLFNLSFIATYQNLLLYWIAVPAYELMKWPTSLSLYDVGVGLLFSGLLVIETLADEQHWVFQSVKHALTAAQRKSHPDPQIRQGFFQSGLFKYSRHPNYFAEQGMWVCVYLFSLSRLWHAASAPRVPVCSSLIHCDYLNWTCLGCIQLILLFQGSMNFGESITLSKYPAYAEYQKTTSQCFPLPRLWDKSVVNASAMAKTKGKTKSKNRVRTQEPSKQD